jgi:hypothetical protein
LTLTTGTPVRVAVARRSAVVPPGVMSTWLGLGLGLGLGVRVRVRG